MTIRAVFFDLGGVIVRTEYQAPRERLAERLNTTYEDLYKIVFESDTSRKASIGAITTDDHWAAIARRLGRPASEAKTLHAEFFAGDVRVTREVPCPKDAALKMLLDEKFQRLRSRTPKAGSSSTWFSTVGSGALKLP